MNGQSHALARFWPPLVPGPDFVVGHHPPPLSVCTVQMASAVDGMRFPRLVGIPPSFIYLYSENVLKPKEVEETLLKDNFEFTKHFLILI